MAREKTEQMAAAPKQIWEHIKTQLQVLVLDVDSDVAYCTLLDENCKVSGLKVAIPLSSLRDWGNRGMAYVGVRKGKLPQRGDLNAFAPYNARNMYLGAQ